jgi:hypothetical protein
MAAKIEFKTLPTSNQWMSASDVSFAWRSNDPVLRRIDTLVEELNRRAVGARSFLYGDLLFCCDYWLKYQPSHPATMEKGRVPAVHALFAHAAAELCKVFACTINVLPRELELAYGRKLTAHGNALDRFGQYAISAKMRKQLAWYRLWFRRGKVYQWNWHETGGDVPTKRVKACSNRAWFGAFSPGWGGFAMSMNREIYMAKHSCPGVENFYHSSYLDGSPVMCAGSMKIVDGIVYGIRVDSGHYQPAVSAVVNVLQALQMCGAPIAQIEIYDYDKNARNGGFVAHAPQFLAANGNWGVLIARQMAEYRRDRDDQHTVSHAQALVRRLYAGWDKGLYGCLADFWRDYSYALAGPTRADTDHAPRELQRYAPYDELKTFVAHYLENLRRVKKNPSLLKTGAKKLVRVSDFAALPPWPGTTNAYPKARTQLDQVLYIGDDDKMSFKAAVAAAKPKAAPPLPPRNPVAYA